MNYAKAISRIKAIGFVFLLSILTTCEMRAQSNDSIVVAPDSSNFVTASLLIAEPVGASSSVFGHVSLRMECPVHHLDYVFTLTNDPNASPFMTGFVGNTDARFVAVPTDTCIRDYRADQRELIQYRLNLTPHEKQELWRLLDEEMMAVSHGKFNFQTNSCLTSTIMTIQQCLIDEHFEWGPMDYPRTLCDGDFLRYTLRESPWTEFLYVTFCGVAYAQHSAEEHRMTPQTIVPFLREAKFVNNNSGESRPVITDKGVVLVKGTIKEKAFPLTPTIVFGILLVLTLLITLAERMLHWRRLAQGFDVVLFVSQALMGILMIYIITCSEIFGSKWNWYIITFFPLPLLIWLCLRKRLVATKCWLAYAILLVLFIMATPLLGELDLPHQLITGSLLIRSISHYLNTSDNNIKKTKKQKK